MLGVGNCLCWMLRFEIVYLAMTGSKTLQEFPQKEGVDGVVKGYQPVARPEVYDLCHTFLLVERAKTCYKI